MHSRSCIGVSHLISGIGALARAEPRRHSRDDGAVVVANGGIFLANRIGATDPTQRKMTRSSEAVTYALYRDAARSQPWGSTVGIDTAAGTGSGFAQGFTVYGRVPPQPTPSPGTYTDTIVITVAY